MSYTEKNVVTRVAPSPSGEMHIGNLRTALYSWLYARQNNGKFILRIEDTDKKRSKIENIKKIKQTLKNFGLNWDEYYCQSERLSLYQHYAHKLVENGSAYICQCEEKSKEQCSCYLTNNPYVTKPYCIKLRVKGNGFDAYDISGKDELRGIINYNSKELYDIVLLKRDGYPTYHLASIVDDHLMGVTDVFRGEEWLSSFPYHILIYNALGFPIPRFYHLSLICNEDGKKLSKRDGDFTANYLLKQGLLPSSILNYIALLGWHPSGNEEFFTIQDLIEKFDVKRLTLSSSCYDYKKLKNLNLKHSKTEQGIKEYYELYKDQYTKARLSHLLYIFQNGMNIDDIMGKLKYDFHDILIDQARISFFRILVAELKDMKEKTFMDQNGILLETNEVKIILQHISDSGYNNKNIHEWIREALTGETRGLPADILLGLLTIEELLDVFEKQNF
jgi:glutamyl-tRNA synthetase